jgi:hypothetical protein
MVKNFVYRRDFVNENLRPIMMASRGLGGARKVGAEARRENALRPGGAEDDAEQSLLSKRNCSPPGRGRGCWIASAEVASHRERTVPPVPSRALTGGATVRSKSGLLGTSAVKFGKVVSLIRMTVSPEAIRSSNQLFGGRRGRMEVAKTEDFSTDG